MCLSTQTFCFHPAQSSSPDYECSNICVENSALPHIELPIRLHTAIWYLTKIDPTSSSSFSYIKSLNLSKYHFKYPVVQTD